jgi:hypothetical protein
MKRTDSTRDMVIKQLTQLGTEHGSPAPLPKRYKTK